MNSFEHPVNCRCRCKKSNISACARDKPYPARRFPRRSPRGNSGPHRPATARENPPSSRRCSAASLTPARCFSFPARQPHCQAAHRLCAADPFGFDHSTPSPSPTSSAPTTVIFPFGWATKKQLARAEALLDQVGAGRLLHKSLGALSGGELQRVLLAFALDPMPDLLLLDRPVSALDRKGAGVFYEAGLLSEERAANAHHPRLSTWDMCANTPPAPPSSTAPSCCTAGPDAVLRSSKVREIFGLELSGGEA